MFQRVMVSCMVLGTVVAVTPQAAQSQIRASERGLVGQTIDGTTMTIDYGRPQVRGREGALFGDLNPWGKIWTPGANWATTFEVNNDITINGHTLTAGKYSLWFELQPEQWTAIFDPEPRRFHLFGPEPAENQLRFPVTPGTGPATEILTFSFGDVRPTGATLRMAWGTTAVAMDVGVSPSRVLTVAETLARRYVGSYVMHRGAPLGGGDVPFEIAYENERLVARWATAPVPRLREFWLVHLGEGMFAAGELENGELFDIVMDAIFEFSPYDGRADSFELRIIGDQLWATGDRSD